MKKNSLLQHNNLNSDYLDFYFDVLSKTDKGKFKKQIQLCYPFMNVKLCNEFNIKKEKSEKERFFQLYNKIINSNPSQIRELIQEEYKFPKELDSLSFTEKEKKDINRWGLFGTKIIEFNNIYNEEYFYYAISNYILKNFKDSKPENYNNFIKTLNSMKVLINKVDRYYKKDPEFFEYVFLFFLNAQGNDSINIINNISLYNAFISSMNLELINKEEKNLLNDKQIIKEFQEKEIEAKIEGKNLILKGEIINGSIKDYKNYYITKELIYAISKKIITLEKPSLVNYLRFEYIKNPKNYFDGLLYQIIEKYASSNLSKTALSQCFNINISEYGKIEEEICTKKIHNYIRMIPYNSEKDTGRTLKQFARILIDSSKQKMMQSIREKIENKALREYLEKFINIVYRKFIFEHEHNHLFNVLLFFYYVDKDYEINTPPKKIKDNKVTLLKNLNKEEQIDRNNVLEESGEIFETVTYGKVQKFFRLKQLLFIANEKNDELSVGEYKKKYNEQMSKKGNLEELFKEFQVNNLILSDLVNKIYSEMKNELSLEKNKGKTFEDFANEIIACKNEFHKGDTNRIKSLEEFGEMVVIKDIEHYDCHIPDKTKILMDDE